MMRRPTYEALARAQVRMVRARETWLDAVCDAYAALDADHDRAGVDGREFMLRCWDMMDRQMREAIRTTEPAADSPALRLVGGSAN